MIQIRFTDMDSQGHVNHLAIIEWVADARVRFIDSIVDQSGVDDIDYVLVMLGVDFKKKIKYPGTISVLPGVTVIGEKSLTTVYTVLDTWDEGIAYATCVNVFFDKNTGETIAMPDDLVDVLRGLV